MKDRKITIEETVRLSKELAQIAMSGRPDCVISIKRGGFFIGKVIAQELDLPHHSIKVKKWYSRVPRFCYSFVRFLRDNLPSPFNRICWYLVIQLVCLINRRVKPKLTGGFNGVIDLDARILLVDDDIGMTGVTMGSTFDYLRQRGFRNISTAVIIQYGKEFIADYSVINNPSLLIIFPWPWRNY